MQVNLWGLDAIKTKGESVAIVLYLVGARPLREATGRVARYQLIPLEASIYTPPPRNPTLLVPTPLLGTLLHMYKSCCCMPLVSPQLLALCAAVVDKLSL